MSGQTERTGRHTLQIIKAARGGITGHFGDTDVPGANVKRHGGMDIGHGTKTAADLLVVAPAAGRVVFAGERGTYGLCMIFDHGDGWESLLAHLSEVTVHPGSEVAQGQAVAVMGDTGGDWPVHLHQELRLAGTQLDPEKYLTNTPVGGAGTPITTTARRDTMARPIRQGTPGQTYYNGWALIGELTFELNPSDEARANEWGRIWNGKSGQYDTVTSTEFHAALAGVNRRRAMIGQPALPLPR
ncbi:peptidase M23-like protein [Microterricola gilva]|uniref:Peptidase M23-like protein n=1 Tax=Microterricola gilva TaxID=393267 RepID=A0A4Q8ARG9_9MICO|nr:M23 family metallopeptidase [Microterricola gilva]RZU66743.1 peptidase M23-like protein [Microterricola gilva]